MEMFKQRIPEGYTAEIENGEIIYTPIEKKCQFEIGDIVVCKSDYGNYDIIRLIHRVSKIGAELKYWSSYDLVTDYKSYEFVTDCDGVIIVSDHKKATPEQEKLFKQKCLESGFWFDKENKKWIQLKEGGLYKCDVVGTKAVFIFDRVSCCGIFSKASIFKSGSVFFGDENCVHNNLEEFDNISEVTEEEKQSLFDALAKKGKPWNADKNCVEELKWVPEDGEEYWIIGSRFDIDKVKNFGFTGDLDRIEFGNCFKTQEECEKYAKYMKECSLNYKPE